MLPISEHSEVQCIRLSRLRKCFSNQIVHYQLYNTSLTSVCMYNYTIKNILLETEHLKKVLIIKGIKLIGAKRTMSSLCLGMC